MKIIIIVILFIFPFKVLGAPDQIEFWFLSEPKSSQIFNFIRGNQNGWIFYNKIASAQNSYFDCTPMGDGCFHPQLGYTDKPAITISEKEKREIKLRTFNSDINLVECDPNNYWDMFCGKARPVGKLGPTKKVAVEIWIDTSTSFKNLDPYRDDDNYCYRKSFIKRILEKCNGQEINVYIFDTSIKMMGGLDSLCNHAGGNNQDRMIEWVRGSKAKKLIVITDINEYSTKIRDFLDSIAGEMRGLDPQGISAKNLIELSEEIISQCPKKNTK